MHEKAYSFAKQIVVVDPLIDDYRCFKGLVKSHSIRMTLTTTGAGGLRLAPSHPDALWLMSIELPDMSGFDLLEMLRATQPRLAVFILDAVYDPVRERRALQLSATRYLCKPIKTDWLTAWQSAIGIKHSATIEMPNSVTD